VRNVGGENSEQVGGYLKILIEKYEMVEKRLPVFARPTAKKGRYYLRDNFLRSWLACLANPVSALNFRPIDRLVEQADERLTDAEGFGLERLVGVLYEERSRKGLGDFSLTDRIAGYWDRSDVEIDLIALDEDSQRVRFGTCKRSAVRLLADLDNCRGHISRFLHEHRRFADWKVEQVAISPLLEPQLRVDIQARGFIAQDLRDLIAGL
jgi:hypothetical protein